MRQELRLVHIAGEQSHINLTRIKNADTGIIRNMIIPGTILIQTIIEEAHILSQDDHIQVIPVQAVHIQARATHIPIFSVQVTHILVIPARVTHFLVIPVRAVHTPAIQDVRLRYLLLDLSFLLLSYQ